MDELEAFIAVAEHGNFTAAARALRMSQPALSRRVQNLEASLGVQLLQRSTRTVTLTDEGRTFFERTREALRELNAARDALTSSRSKPAGRLRVEAPSIIGRHLIAPALPSLLAKHRDLEVELSIHDGAGTTGVEVAVRFGTQPDSSLVAKKLGVAKMLLCASREYLKKKGTPRTVEALHQHDRLGLVIDGAVQQWRLNDVAFNARHRVLVHDADALLSLAEGGAGIAWVCDFMLRPSLVPILTNTVTPEQPIFAVCQPTKFTLPRVRVFIEHTRQVLAQRNARGGFSSPTKRRSATYSP